jgi:hypothetical protein
MEKLQRALRKIGTSHRVKSDASTWNGDDPLVEKIRSAAHLLTALRKNCKTTHDRIFEHETLCGTERIGKPPRLQTEKEKNTPNARPGAQSNSADSTHLLEERVRR